MFSHLIDAQIQDNIRCSNESLIFFELFCFKNFVSHDIGHGINETSFVKYHPTYSAHMSQILSSFMYKFLFTYEMHSSEMNGIMSGNLILPKLSLSLW